APRQRRAAAATDLAKLAESGDGQISRTDPDARLLAKHGQIVAGYNVQIAVDDKHKLIVASEVVNEGNDTGQLYAMAQAAKAALGVAALTAVADAGYDNGETLKACEGDAITAYVPPPDRGQRLKAQDRFSIADFRYDTGADVYRCPAGSELRPMHGQKRQASGKMAIRYASRRSVCLVWPLRARCLAGKGERREIERWADEDVIERHRARMRAAGEDMMRRRKALAEHPFGTLKCRAGYRHFLVRGFDKVRGEWSLMALCYNFTRVLNILGFDRFVAYLEKLRIAREDLLAVTLRAIRLLCSPSGPKFRYGLQSGLSELPQSHNQYSCPASTGKSLLELLPSRPVEGRWPSSRTLGEMRWTLWLSQDERCLRRTAKPCGPDAPTLASSFAGSDSCEATVAKEPGHRGERGISRKPSSREGRGGSSNLWRLSSCAV